MAKPKVTLEPPIHAELLALSKELTRTSRAKGGDAVTMNGAVKELLAHWRGTSRLLEDIGGER